MKLTSNALTKRIHSSMRKERAPIKATYHIKTLSKSLHQHKSRDAQHFTRHSMYPIAVRLDTWFPQSEVKGKSTAPTARKARQIRRKSKTHTRN